LLVAGGIVAATFGTAVAWLDTLTTDQELRTSVAEHNLADTSHPRAALRAEAQERAIAELQASRAQTIELWRVLVGLGCADREDDRRLKAASAAYCRDEYDAKISKGSTAPDAYRESIRQPWYNRPRIR
jgi:hypothetical protein